MLVPSFSAPRFMRTMVDVNLIMNSRNKLENIGRKVESPQLRLLTFAVTPRAVAVVTSRMFSAVFLPEAFYSDIAGLNPEIVSKPS
jgi:hypothetical protein